MSKSVFLSVNIAFQGDERDFDELCRTAYIPTKKEEKQDMSLQKLVATSRVASRRGNVSTKIPKTKTRRHLKRGQCPGNILLSLLCLISPNLFLA